MVKDDQGWLRIRKLGILKDDQGFLGKAKAGRKIAPNTGANATKFFALTTKSLKLVANLAIRISNHTLIPRDPAIVEDLLR